jgi:hypothetical protein
LQIFPSSQPPRDDAIVVVEERTMIDGLKLTMTGEELRKRLDERVKRHERLVAWYKREATREPDPANAEDCVLPEHMCEYEEEFHDWRAQALAYIREHIEGGEVYRLSEADLAFGEILPEKPGMVEQDDYEREGRVGSSLERMATAMSGSSCGTAAFAAALAGAHQRPTRIKPAKRRQKARAGASKAR